MTEHGWPDHHDDHGLGDEQHDPLHAGDEGAHEVEPLPLPDDDHGFFDVHHDPVSHDEPAVEHDPGYQHEDTPAFEHHDLDQADHADPVDGHESAVGADPDALPDHAGADTVFPPAVDVGPLPEPVDGFPWIDTGSLGVIDTSVLHDAPVHDEPVDPHELAGYAGVDLPPGADPWAVLADSEDPATAALARWWSAQ